MEPNPTATAWLLLRKALGRHEEGKNPFDSMGKGHERSLWKQEEAQVKVQCPAAPDAHGRAFASVLGYRLVRGTPSTTGNIPALPVPSQRLPLSFSLARGRLQPDQLPPNCTDPPFPD